MAQVIKKATRESFGMALCELAKTNKDIIVFDADLAAANAKRHQGRWNPRRFQHRSEQFSKILQKSR